MVAQHLARQSPRVGGSQDVLYGAENSPAKKNIVCQAGWRFGVLRSRNVARIVRHTTAPQNDCLTRHKSGHIAFFRIFRISDTRYEICQDIELYPLGGKDKGNSGEQRGGI